MKSLLSFSKPTAILRPAWGCALCPFPSLGGDPSLGREVGGLGLRAGSRDRGPQHFPAVEGSPGVLRVWVWGSEPAESAWLPESEDAPDPQNHHLASAGSPDDR